MTKNIKLTILSLYFTFILFSPAYAYLDPGTINIVLQTILAAIAGVIATYRLWLLKLQIFLSKIIKRFKSVDNNFKKK